MQSIIFYFQHISYKNGNTTIKFQWPKFLSLETKNLDTVDEQQPMGNTKGTKQLPIDLNKLPKHHSKDDKAKHIINLALRF